MLPQELIRKKRNGLELSSEELRWIAAGIGDGRLSEGQVAAFAMAVYFQGMSRAERVALTEGMRDSGRVLSWDGLPGPVLDKHSTGGVGDNVSLILGPLVAACGGFVPMISGRGLGHTGGTLDKLDSIPGYRSQPGEELFRKVVEDCGVAIIGQTEDLAPADRRFYATRDITATVESLDLITASILSKKLAAGLQALVMDVKTGNGAFMEKKGEARDLARSIVEVAEGAGVRTRALITDMNQPLASAAGNALEAREALAVLKGERRGSRIEEVVFALSAELLELGGLATSMGEAREKLEAALVRGRGAEVFAKMVRGLGGPSDLLENTEKILPRAPYETVLKSTVSGWVIGVETRQLGLAVVELGGGRKRAEDAIDLAVGLSEIVPVGSRVEVGEPLLRVHAASEGAQDRVFEGLKDVFMVSDAKPGEIPLVLERIVEESS